LLQPSVGVHIAALPNIPAIDHVSARIDLSCLDAHLNCGGMSDGYPDCPEPVALALLREIEAAEEKLGERSPSNRRKSAEMLDLYAECLKAVCGNGATGATLH
jgi:hypothetical protein